MRLKNYFLYSLVVSKITCTFAESNNIINIKSTLLWTNYKTFKISSMSFEDNE